MAITVKCRCGQLMQVDEKFAGKTGKCSACGKPNKIPTLEEIEAFRKSKQSDGAGKKKTTTIERKKPGKPARPGGKKRSESGRESGLRSGRKRSSRRGKSSRISGSRRSKVDDGLPKKKLPIVPIFAGLGAIAMVAIVVVVLMTGPDLEAAAATYQEFIDSTVNINRVVIELCDEFDEKEVKKVGEFTEKLDDVKEKWKMFDRSCDEFPDAVRSTLTFGDIDDAVDKLENLEKQVNLMYRVRENETRYKRELAVFRDVLKKVRKLIENSKKRMTRKKQRILDNRI